jgi:2,3-bisphosphoglycerate-dependent phosphoglycerate mutase
MVESRLSKVPTDPILRSLTYLDLEQKLSALAAGNFPAPVKDLTSVPSRLETLYKFKEDDETELKKPVVVIIRHGKTEYNQLGLFTGWEDAQLAEEGREEARAAGRLLKAHGIEFDVVYTSWLSRAIETAWTVLNELDSIWLPIIKSWRLNERMYGALTGLPKKMIAQKHGREKYMKWRRGYKARPPVVSSFSSHYPGNDERYLQNVKDMRISVFESLIRSIAHGRVELHRKYPKTESLFDCTQRTIPYFKNVIVPGSIAQNKSVLIASSENAIRGLLMHLCEIPSDKIHELEIPTGVPLVYDVKRKRIRLLDDGLYPDPLERYDFGGASDFLFIPCDKEDNSTLTVPMECYTASNGKLYTTDPVIRLKSINLTSLNNTSPICIS